MAGILTLPDMIKARAEAEPHRMLAQEIDGATQTYAEFYSSVLTWADAFDRIGLGRGETVVTMINTSLAAYHAWLGAAWLSALEVAVNHAYKGHMLQYTINDSGARIIVLEEEFVPQLAAVAAQLPQLEKVVVLGREPLTAQLPWQVFRSEEFMAGAEPRPRPGPLAHEALGIIYTSGTTGTSKGVLCSWAELYEGLDNPFPGDAPDTYEDGAYYCPWMPFHMSGKNALEHAVGLGLRLVVRPRFSVTRFWDDVRRYRCTHTLLPFIAPWLWRQPPADGDADNPLRRVCMAPLIPEYREFEKRFDVKVSTAWSSTEAGFPVNTADPVNYRTCGTVRDGYEIQIVDELDYPVEDGAIGELLVRHKQPWRVFNGYWNKPEATARAWRNGWFHTGDAFTRDTEGNLYFADRLQDYIKHHGHNISAAEVEREVNAHESVIESICVGVPSDLYEADVVADDEVRIFVVCEPGSLTANELIDFLRPRMAGFMLPRYIDIVEELPRNHLNKPVRAELKARPVGPETFDSARAAQHAP
jgi:carnitine-CoA ligase